MRLKSGKREQKAMKNASDLLAAMKAAALQKFGPAIPPNGKRQTTNRANLYAMPAKPQSMTAQAYRAEQKETDKTRTIRALILQLAEIGLPLPEKERYGLIPGRRFHVDLFWATAGLIVEYEGGTFQHGKPDAQGKIQQSRHLNPIGFSNDCEKYNLLQLAGFVVLRFDALLVRNGKAAEQVYQAYQHLAPAHAMIQAAFGAPRPANVTPIFAPHGAL